MRPSFSERGAISTWPKFRCDLWPRSQLWRYRLDPRMTSQVTITRCSQGDESWRLLCLHFYCLATDILSCSTILPETFAVYRIIWSFDHLYNGWKPCRTFPAPGGASLCDMFHQIRAFWAVSIHAPGTALPRSKAGDLAVGDDSDRRSLISSRRNILDRYDHTVRPFSHQLRRLMKLKTGVWFYLYILPWTHVHCQILLVFRRRRIFLIWNLPSSTSYHRFYQLRIDRTTSLRIANKYKSDVFHHVHYAHCDGTLPLRN